MNSATRSAARIVDFFDRRAVDYNHAYGHETTAGYALRVRRKKVLELFDRPGGVVLDVGCGPGIMAEEMLARGCQFYGIDPAETMISIAQERYGGSARFLLGDAARLPFANGFFDAVICTGVVDSLVDGSQAVGEMVRVLKPGGTFIISFANLISPYAWWKNFVYYPALGVWHRLRALVGDPTMTASRMRDCPLRHMYTRRGARALIESQGAQVTVCVPYHFNVFLSPLDELMPRTALRATQAMEEGIGRWPDWLAAGWIVKARKA